MTDDLKYIVTEINKLLGTEYNLISFELAPETLLQLLVDVLHKLDSSAKFDVKEMETEETNRRIIESLKKIQYQPKAMEVDPGKFHKALLLGDKKVIHPIFRWIFQNRQRVEKSAYLAKYLLPLNLPPEAMAMAEITNVYQQYKMSMEEFKEAHKLHAASAIQGTQTRELKNDINAIESEASNVRKRIERTQTKLDKIPQQELLLETARSLRIEKERNKELQVQIEEQQQDVHRSNLMHDRLKKELNNAKNAAQGTSPAHLLENVVEETQVLDFMVQQKLPQELKARQTEVQILQEVLEEPNLSRNYLTELQARIDEVNKEVQRSIDKKITEHGSQNDSLGPFRQQALIVARNKESAAEQLDQLTKELRDVETSLAQKQQQLQQSVGEIILRGDELKQFVSTLRAKSNVYKQQRAELTSVKAEINDLLQTLENLKSHDPTLTSTLNQVISDTSNPESLSLDPSDGVGLSSIETHGVTELKRLVEGLSRAVVAARERLTPLSQEVRPLRERLTDLKDERDVKKQAFDALNATLDSEAAAIKSDISSMENSILKLENDWKEHKLAIDRAEMLLEKASDELMGISTIGGQRLTLKETLSQQIWEQEKLLMLLQERKNTLQATKQERAKQVEMWSDVASLFEVKAKCYRDAKMLGPGGTISVTGEAETFTLQ